MSDRLRPLHSSVARERLHRVYGMSRIRLNEEQREFAEGLALSIFTEMTNAGHTFQSALCAIYLSGLKHGAESGTTP